VVVVTGAGSCYHRACGGRRSALRRRHTHTAHPDHQPGSSGEGLSLIYVQQSCLWILVKLVCTLFRHTDFLAFLTFQNIFHKSDPTHLHGVVIVYFKTLNLPHFPIFLFSDLKTVLMKNIMLKPPLLQLALLPWQSMCGGKNHCSLNRKNQTCLHIGHFTRCKQHWSRSTSCFSFFNTT